MTNCSGAARSVLILLIIGIVFTSGCVQEEGLPTEEKEESPLEGEKEVPQAGEEAGTTLVAQVGGNGTYSSIQEAIESTREGGTVQVSQGTYLETITITAPKTLTLQGGWNQEFTSRSDESSLTVIDGGAAGSVVDIRAGPGVAIALTIEGFTIQNGEADYGGGISIASGDSLNLNLINNNISGNTANKEGGGISIVSVGGSINATLINNTISGNIATGEGGGIHVNSASAGSAEVTLTGNIITDNTVTNPFEEPPSDGGGIAAYASDSDAVTKLQLTNNLITKNEAGAGGGIWAYAWGPNAILTMVLTNNIIAGNKAVHGAGIFSASGASCPITKPGGSVICNLTNNIITGNTASVGDSGIIIMSGSTYGDGGSIILSMQNDIIWGNADPRGGEQLVVIVAEGRSGVATATASYSDIGLIKSYHGGSYTLENVINENPLFVDSANQVFLLRDNSPCIDAGDPGPAYNDGCRPPARGTERNDMGAYGGPNGCGWGEIIQVDVEEEPKPQEKVISGYIRDCSFEAGENIPISSARISYGDVSVSSDEDGRFSITVEGDSELRITARGYHDYKEKPSRMVDNAFYLIPDDVYQDLFSVVLEEQESNPNNWMRKWTRQPEIIIAKEDGSDSQVNRVVHALGRNIFSKMTSGLYSSDDVTVLDELPEGISEDRSGKLLIYFADEMMDGGDVVTGGCAYSQDNGDGDITHAEVVWLPDDNFGTFQIFHELAHAITSGGHINYKASIVSETQGTPYGEPTEADYKFLNCVYNSPLKRSN